MKIKYGPDGLPVNKYLSFIVLYPKQYHFTDAMRHWGCSHNTAKKKIKACERYMANPTIMTALGFSRTQVGVPYENTGYGTMDATTDELLNWVDFREGAINTEFKWNRWRISTKHAQTGLTVAERRELAVYSRNVSGLIKITA